MCSIVASVISIMSTIIIEEYKFLGGLGGELQIIKNEFQQMMDFLEGADMLVQDNPQLKSWVRQVRDVAYEVEDVLDEFVMRCSHHHSTGLHGTFQKMYRVKARHQLASRIQKIKNQIQGISDAHIRYKEEYKSGLPSRTSRVNIMEYDRRGDGLFLKEADLVGIEVPRKELTDLILTEDKQRNVISVVGMGGLGKTTLVKKVYDDLAAKFTHHAWITFSESFKLKEVLKKAIRQLYIEESRQLPQELDDMDCDALKTEIVKLLETKTYIVVFDDIWQRRDWNAIHVAFPRNDVGSRILITTRNNDVGRYASGSEARVYKMKTLPDEEARKLLCKIAFGRDVSSCPQNLEQICEKILRACKGLPFKIEVIGRDLAREGQRTSEWERYFKVLGALIEHDDMTQLLSKSYHVLSHHLKNCFMYLSIFPEDTTIDTGLLTRLWIGEGFVERKVGSEVALEEVAQLYIRELVDRFLVQVAATDDRGSIVAIRVHDIIRKVILLWSMEHNLTTIFVEQDGMSFPNKVRRLSVQGTIADNIRQFLRYCKSTRTLFMCKHVGGQISESSLSHFLSDGWKLLKVLDLKGAQLEKFSDEIFKLFHLKYLSLENTNVSFVPKSIGMLQRLQYLILLGTHVKVLPAEIQKLRNLRYLSIGRIESSTTFVRRLEDVQGVKVSFRISKNKFLQQLYYMEADQVCKIRVVTEIRKLIHLEVLGITKLKEADGKELCSSLKSLKNLRELSVYAISKEEFIDFHYFGFADIPPLQKLVMAGRLARIPELIYSLNELTEIDLQYSKLRDDPLECLQDLPNLINLRLTDAYEGDSLGFQTGGFLKLKKLDLFLLENLISVTVQENALPSLEELRLRGCPSMKKIPIGIQYLVHLQNLDFSNMSNEFLNKLENLDKKSAAYQRILQIPLVLIATWTDGELSESRRLDKETGTFN